MRPEQQSVKPRSMRIILFTLLYLAILSTIVTSFTVSFYSSKTSGDAQAQVATFAAEYSSGAQTITLSLSDMKPGDTRVIALEVENKSDVSISYSLQASCIGHLPLSFSISPATGTLLLGDGKAAHTMTVTWPPEQKDAQLATEIDAVTVTLQYEQLD